MEVFLSFTFWTLQQYSWTKIFLGYFPFFRLFPQHFHFDSKEYGRWHGKMVYDIVPAKITFSVGRSGRGVPLGKWLGSWAPAWLLHAVGCGSGYLTWMPEVFSRCGRQNWAVKPRRRVAKRQEKTRSDGRSSLLASEKSSGIQGSGFFEFSVFFVKKEVKENKMCH